MKDQGLFWNSTLASNSYIVLPFQVLKTLIAPQSSQLISITFTFTFTSSTMADVEDVAAAGQPKKRTFRKFSYRGIDLDALLDISTDELVKLFPARVRRRYSSFKICIFLLMVTWGLLVFFLSCWIFHGFVSNYVECCRFSRGLKRKPMALIKKLRKAVCFVDFMIFRFDLIFCMSFCGYFR